MREENALVHEVMRTRPELKGIGAVAAVAWFGGDPARGAFCQIGDCRVYRLRSGRLEQLSADDRWLAEQVRNGAMTPTEARSHPLKNVVTRAISGSDVNVDVHSIALRPGDRVILCTDGVWEHTSDAVLAECCSERSFEVAWSRLLRPESGDVAVPDDASLAIVEIEE